MNIRKNKFVGAVAMLAFVISSVISPLIFTNTAYAASLTGISDIMSREAKSVNSSHTILFTSTTAMVAGNTIAVAFPSGFTTTGLVIGDLSICHGTTGLNDGAGSACTSNDETIAASAGASTVWGATITGTTTITFTAPSGSWTHAISAGNKVTIIIAATHMVNPTSVSTPNVTITTTSDSGSFTVPIVDSDQVTVSASVNQTITFDLDASITGTASTAPYSVALGTLTSSAVNHSDGSTINMIVVNGGTNASGGMTVTLANANGANGLVSTSTPADKIVSATSTMAAGTANYGVCLDSGGSLAGFTAQGAYATATPCTTASSTNHVVGLSATPTAILATTAPVSGAKGEVFVNATVAASTPAHSDYADTLTFIGTATF